MACVLARAAAKALGGGLGSVMVSARWRAAAAPGGGAPHSADDGRRRRLGEQRRGEREQGERQETFHLV